MTPLKQLAILIILFIGCSDEADNLINELPNHPTIFIVEEIYPVTNNGMEHYKIQPLDNGSWKYNYLWITDSIGTFHKGDRINFKLEER